MMSRRLDSLASPTTSSNYLDSFMYGFDVIVKVFGLDSPGVCVCVCVCGTCRNVAYKADYILRTQLGTCSKVRSSSSYAPP